MFGQLQRSCTKNQEDFFKKDFWDRLFVFTMYF